MKLQFNWSKWFWTKDKDVTSAWFEFDYEDIKEVNDISELFKIKIWDFETNATINKTAHNPIVIDTLSWVWRYKWWEADTTLIDVIWCMIKLDIYINDQVCWLLRIEEITIKLNVWESK